MKDEVATHLPAGTIVFVSHSRAYITSHANLLQNRFIIFEAATDEDFNIPRMQFSAKSRF